jgi:tRNA/tmRNA/rRNA uracil-C5-methylase (TrmA/RlmC/RlmD family)
MAPTHLSPPRTRRRATLHAQAIGRRVVIGFREGGSHKTVDMRECHVIAPELFALVAPLRALLESWQDRKLAVDVEMVWPTRAWRWALPGWWPTIWRGPKPCSISPAPMAWRG